MSHTAEVRAARKVVRIRKMKKRLTRVMKEDVQQLRKMIAARASLAK